MNKFRCLVRIDYFFITQFVRIKSTGRENWVGETVSTEQNEKNQTDVRNVSFGKRTITIFGILAFAYRVIYLHFAHYNIFLMQIK